MDNIPVSAQHFRSAPWNDVTKDCPDCGQTIYRDGEDWIHWNTGKIDCETNYLLPC